jgi:ubiquinone/menaquinone biosynthesis C-methylase UbiE
VRAAESAPAARPLPPPHLRAVAPAPANTTPHALARVRRFYSERWARGQVAREQIFRSWWQVAYDQMHAWAGPLSGRRVAVLFVGLGDDALAYAASGAEVVGIDFALPALVHATRAAKATSAPPRYVCADVSALPLAPQSLDVVFVINGICHTDKARVLAECQRVLRPGGSVFLLEALRHPHLAIAARWLEPFLWFAPLRFLSVAELERLGRDFGLVRQRQFFVLSVLSAMLLRLPLCGRLFSPLHRLLTRIDGPLLRAAPFLRHVSYLTVAELRVVAPAQNGTPRASV